MLNEGTTDYPRSLTKKQMHDDPPSLQKSCSDQLVQKWIGMVDRCLEQQWKDSQQLLGCTKALKDSGTLSNSSLVIKDLSDLGLEMMQRSIDMRQELVNNAYAIDLLEQPVKNLNRHSQCCDDGSSHIYSNPAVASGVEISSINPGDPSCYIYLPSSPESDVYEPLITKIHPQSTKDDEHKRLSDSSDIGSYYSPFTLHSKLWQRQRLHQKHSDSPSLSSSSPSSITSSFLVSASTTTLRTLNSPGHDNGKANLRTILVQSPSVPANSQDDHVTTPQYHKDKSKFTPISTTCNESHLPSSLPSGQVTTTSDLDIQCDQCFFWPRQRSLSLGELAGSVNNGNSPRTSICSQTANTADRDKTNRISASVPPTIPIPIRTSSSLDTPFIIQLPKATVSTPILQTNTNTTASHITPSTSSSSVVHTMSSKFHFKRNATSSSKKKSMIPISASSKLTPIAFSHHCTASAIDSNDNTNDGTRSNRFVRSFITRKVSFPAIFSSKKIHPSSSVSSNTEPPNGLFI